jgi:hypothetical protein
MFISLFINASVARYVFVFNLLRHIVVLTGQIGMNLLRGTLGPKQDATIEFSLNEIEHDTPQNKTTSQTPDTALLKLLQ